MTEEPSEYKSAFKKRKNESDYMTEYAPPRRGWMAMTIPAIFDRLREQSVATNWDILIAIVTIAFLISEKLVGMAYAAYPFQKEILALFIVFVLTRKFR